MPSKEQRAEKLTGAVRIAYNKRAALLGEMRASEILEVEKARKRIYSKYSKRLDAALSALTKAAAARVEFASKHPRIGEEWEYSVKGFVTRTAKIDVIAPETYTPHYGSMSDGVNPGDLGLRVSADQIIPLRHIDGLGYSEWMPKGMKPTKENVELTRSDEYWAWG